MAKPSGGQAPKKGKKNRKLGRNESQCKAYRADGRAEKNRLRRMRRHLKQARHANDERARSLYNYYS